MNTNRLKLSKTAIIAHFAIALIVLSLFPITFVDAIGATSPPDITLKLNGTEIEYDKDITIKDKDKLEFIADFKAMDAGGVYEVELPGIFTTLNEATIKESNKDIMKYINLTITKDEATGKQRIRIEFLAGVDAASFSFWAIADIQNKDIEHSHEIIINDDMTISITPTQPTQPPGEYVGPSWPLPKVPENNRELNKSIKNEISEKEFLEDTNVKNALFYYLELNLAQRDFILDGTLKDNLPTGMKLFLPSAPNCGKDSYESAFMSFSIHFATTLIKGADDDHCYIDIADLYGAAEEYIGYVNAIEISQGRPGLYTTSDLAPTIKVPAYIAASIKNEDGKYVSYGGSALGYKIDEAGIIQITMIDKSHEDLFEQKHTGPWTNTSLYIPLYDTADCETSIHVEYRVYKQITLQNAGNDTASPYREYLGSTVNGTKTSYRWSYRYNGVEEFVLVVTNDMQTDSDSFEIEMKGTADSFSFGKALLVYPRIYFDQTKWNIPSDGEITFTNTLTYNYWEKTIDTKYVYDFGSSGTVITDAGKTVEDGKTNHLNPDADSTIQKYGLTFRKLGDEKIPAGNFEVFDRLDNNLVFVTKSLKIFKETAENDWSDITDSSKIADNSSTTTTTDGVNLKAYYDSDLHRIIVVNVGYMVFTGRIKVEFETELSPDVEYGTKITNYFRENVETFVNHKLSLHKTDPSGNTITSGPASFSIQYTTDSDFTSGTLHDLTDSHGNPFNSLSTGTSGIADAMYQIDADIFYLKIQETASPDGYVKISEPIWIKATRDPVTQKMTYSSEIEADGVEISVSEKGLVTIEVENTKVSPAEPKPTDLSLKAKKVTIGKDLLNGQFNFAIYENGLLAATGTNTADGKITFTPISYTAAGNHTYTIKELSQSDENWKMDEREFTITVNVDYDNDGALTAVAVYPDEGVVFVNKYENPEKPSIVNPESPNTSNRPNITLAALIVLATLSLCLILSISCLRMKRSKR